MAYVSNMDDEQKQDPNAPQQGAVAPVGGSGAVHLSPSSAVPTVGGGGTAGPSGATPASAGGSFASLDKYLGANQGQAEPLAGKLTSSIGNQYNNLSDQTNSTLSGINSQIAANATPSNYQDTIAQESANPVSFANDPGNVKSFQSLLNASYAGPASAEGTTDFSNQQTAINNAISSGTANTTTEAGRENLLSQNEATPTSGVTALNSAILSESPTALGSVENAYKPFNNLLTTMQTGAGIADKQIATNQAQATAANTASNNTINKQINDLNTGVTGALTTAQQNAAAQNAQIKSDLAAGTPSVTDLQALGMTSAQWNALSAADKAAATSQVVQSNQGQFGANTGTTNIDLTGFLTQQDPNVAYTTANVATPDQYNQANAFQTLLNGMNLGSPVPLLNSANANQAGTAPTNLNTYDYNTAAGTTEATAAAEQAAAQAYVDALQSGADEQHAQLAAANAAKNGNEIAASTSLIGLPTAALEALGVGGDVGKYATQFTNTIGAPIRKAVTSPAAQTVVNGSTAPKNVVAQNAINSVGLGIPQAVTAIANIFCFHPDTQVEMANGSTKAICKITIGDDTRGGKVVATTRGLGQGFYWYFGVLVTGKHAVKEDGVWVRVENSKHGREFKYLTEVVCNLVTDKHRIWSNGIEFADEHENDNYENLNLQESLDALNQNG